MYPFPQSMSRAEAGIPPCFALEERLEFRHMQYGSPGGACPVSQQEKPTLGTLQKLSLRAGGVMVKSQEAPDALLREVKRLQRRVVELEREVAGDAGVPADARLMRAAVASSQSAITITDLSGTITYSNPACLQMWGFRDLAEVAGRPASDFVADREALAESIVAVREKGFWRGSLKVTRADGTLFEVDAYSSLVRDRNGNPTAMIASLVDVTEQHRAWEALQQTEHRLRAILATSPDVIVVLDRQGMIEYINRTVTKASPEEVIGRHGADFIQEPYRAAWERTLREVLEAGASRTLEYEAVGRWCRGRFAPLRNGHEIHGALVIVTDITERRRAREDLAEARTRLQLALQASNIGAWDWNIQTNEVYYSPEWKAHLGYADHELPGRYEEWETRLHPEDRDRVVKALDAYVKGAEPEYDVEFRLRHKDGSYRWIRTRGELIRDTEGKPSHMFGCHVDITESRRLAEERQDYANRLETLRELDLAILEAQSLHAIAATSLSLLNRLVPHDYACVIVFEPGSDQGVVVTARPPKDECFDVGERVSLEETGVADAGEGLHLKTVDNTAAQADPKAMCRRLAVEGLYSYMGVPILARDTAVGVLIVAARKKAAFRSTRVATVSEVAEALGVAIRQAQMRDELRRYAEELERRVDERTEELQESNVELEFITSSLVDELQVPLRAIRGFVREMLEEHSSKLEKEIQLLAEVISHSATGMKEQLDAIYDFTVAGQKELVRRAINMEAVVRGILKDMLNPDPIMLEGLPHTEVGKLPSVTGDAALIGKVWEILLSNAFKFTETKSSRHIEIGARPGGEEHIYFVRDNGVGFDERHAEKLFAMFKRLHGPSEFPGTGAGLAIARRIVRRHKGRIWGRGRVDEGATFYFALPVDVLEGKG